MKRLWMVGLMLSVIAGAWAQNVVLKVVGSGDGDAGGVVVVEAVVLNPGDDALVWRWPRELGGWLSGADGEQRVRLQGGAAGGAVTVAPGGFATRRWRLALPAESKQSAQVLELEPWPGQRLVVAGPVPSRQGELVEGAAEQARSPAAMDSATSLDPTTARVSMVQRTFLERFSEHEPVYFIYGPDSPVAKFQFSFKYRLLSDTPEGRRRRVLGGLHFGYTQRSLWDIQGDSSPFYDSSYMPELMFEWLAPAARVEGGGFHWLGFQAGYRHQSNGRDGANSRSLNIAYLRPAVMFGQPDGWNLIVASRLFTYVGDREDNPDIADYFGYGELLMSFSKNDRFALTVVGQLGKDWDKGSVEVNVTVPIRFALGDFASFFLVQYFNGYGESLINYNERDESIRAGFSFVR